jgi:large subunit ribosomal protein L7/L12
MADEEKKVEETKEVAEETKTETKAEISAKFKDLVANLDKLSVLELSELVKALEDHWGVSAAAPVAVAAAGAGAAADAPAAEEKTSFDVILASGGDKKIQVIKVVREIKPELGLVEAKNLVEAAPKELLKGAKKEDAEEAKKKLEEAGATVELK